ncbi:hypothetical protein NDU88_010560 [Pleurodeles waltl]|uniref:Uncharacterized protein n=1 Tax=Pleurodeles waltl TaxID=8319 RepID=A0AAV7S4C1_PLEWA|nr:hypothetical protein NDU88_010560 [Pleurodeles waltl]
MGPDIAVVARTASNVITSLIVFVVLPTKFINRDQVRWTVAWRYGRKLVQKALQLLQEARHMDLVQESDLEHLRLARKESGGVAAAMWACSPLGSPGVQGSSRQAGQIGNFRTRSTCSRREFTSWGALGVVFLGSPKLVDVLQRLGTRQSPRAHTLQSLVIQVTRRFEVAVKV